MKGKGLYLCGAWNSSYRRDLFAALVIGGQVEGFGHETGSSRLRQVEGLQRQVMLLGRCVATAA